VQVRFQMTLTISSHDIKLEYLTIEIEIVMFYQLFFFSFSFSFSVSLKATRILKKDERKKIANLINIIWHGDVLSDFILRSNKCFSDKLYGFA